MDGVGVRESFDASLDVSDLLVEVDDCGALGESDLASIASVFNRWGLTVIEHAPADDDPAAQVVALGGHLGSTYAHNRADERGIVRMAPLKPDGVYLGATNREHPLHSDGAYDPQPPPLLALQCVVPATTGGASVAVSALALWNHLAETDPDALRALQEPDALLVERADQRDTKSVFSSVDGGGIAVWRDDHTSTFADDPETTRAVELVRAFLADPSNVLTFVLAPNQILLLDNWSVLHGRTAFADGDRRLHSNKYDTTK